MRPPFRRLVSCSLLLALSACSGESAPPAPSAAAKPAPAKAKVAKKAEVEPDAEVSSMLALASLEREKKAVKKVEAQPAPKVELKSVPRGDPAPRTPLKATVASGSVDTAKLGSRGLLHWFPKDSYFVLRVPHVESLGELKRRTTVGALLQNPAVLMGLCAPDGPLGQLNSKVHAELPELEALLEKLPELKGELVVGLVHGEAPPAQATPGSDAKGTFALAFDAGAAADELQKTLDPLLERLQRENQGDCAKPGEGWGLIGRHAEACFEIRRFGNVFTALYGSDPEFTDALHPSSDAPGFAGAAVVSSGTDLNAEQQGVLEFYLNADPAWALVKQRAPADAQAVIEKLGLLDVHGASLALGLGKKGMAEADTWSAPAHADIVSRVLAGAPAERELARWIPEDATTAGLHCFDLRQLYETITGLLPESSQAELKRGLEQCKKQTRIDLVAEVVQNLGPSFALVSRGDALNFISGPTGVCLMIQTQDDDKVGELIGKLMPLLPPTLKRRASEIAHHSVLSFDLSPLGMQLSALCLCRVDGALLLATDEKLLERCLLAGKEPGVKQPALAQALAGEGVIGASLSAAVGDLPATLTVMRKTPSGLAVASTDGTGSMGSGMVMVLPILSSIAIPKLMAARMEANEAAAVANMRWIGSAEAVLESSGAIDVDRDGAGEYGSLGELAGATPLRGSDEFLRPAIMAEDAHRIVDGVLTRSGYHFVAYLPAQKKGSFCEPRAKDGSDISANDAEIDYIVLAWPVNAPQTGRRIYALDQEGDLVCCENPGCKYSGLEHRPAFDAYLPAEASVDRASGKPYVGRDGKTWVMVPDPRR